MTIFFVCGTYLSPFLSFTSHIRKAKIIVECAFLPFAICHFGKKYANEFCDKKAYIRVEKIQLIFVFSATIEQNQEKNGSADSIHCVNLIGAKLCTQNPK